MGGKEDRKEKEAGGKEARRERRVELQYSRVDVKRVDGEIDLTAATGCRW